MSKDSGTLALLSKGKQKTKEVQFDALQEVAHEVENLTQDSAYALIPTLNDDVEFNSFRLGGVLSVIRTHKWFGEHGSFSALVEERFRMSYRSAAYLAEVYDRLINNNIPWDKVKDVGWTKLRELSRVLTEENVDYWVDQAKGCTVAQLLVLIKNSLKPAGTGGEAEEGPSITSDTASIKFQLHSDQKEVIRAALDKCKEETDTEFDNVALERICTGYLGGTIHAAGAADLQTLMANAGWEEALNTFGALFPNINVSVQV